MRKKKRKKSKVKKVYVRLIDSPTRSLVKSIVWRIIGFILLGAISWIFTKDIETATIVTVTFHVIRFFLYYFHERMWERSKWGQEKEKL